ncbi:hypothetical protein ACLEPN_00265 [Myxococcus sp. 1LA]
MSNPTKPGQRPPSHPQDYEPDKSRPDVFDPALKHYAAAFVKGPTRFENAREASSFSDARARLLRQCLMGIGRSSADAQVVARGSAVLAHWYRREARPAKDIDLVVTPDTVAPGSREGTQLLKALKHAVTDALRRVFEEKKGMWKEDFDAGVFAPASAVDWRNFALEHPSLAQGNAETLRARLEKALQRRPQAS